MLTFFFFWTKVREVLLEGKKVINYYRNIYEIFWLIFWKSPLCPAGAQAPAFTVGQIFFLPNFKHKRGVFI